MTDTSEPIHLDLPNLLLDEIAPILDPFGAAYSGTTDADGREVITGVTVAASDVEAVKDAVIDYLGG